MKVVGCKWKFEKRIFELAGSTCIIGIVAGTGANLLGILLSKVEKWFLSFEENAKMPVSLLVSPWQRLFSVFIAACICAVFWFFLHKKIKLISVNEALAGKKMPLIGTMLNAVIQTFYIGAGGSVGREAAPRELSAVFAQNFIKSLKKYFRIYLTDDDVVLLIAAAAGAGLAGQYVAPLSGTFFSIELLYKKFSKKSISVCLIMSIIATVIGATRTHYQPYYLLAGKNINFNLLPFVIILAPVLGVLGSLFRRGVKLAKKKRITDKRILYTLPITGLLTGIIAYFLPYIMGNGRGIAQLAYNVQKENNSIVICLLICIIAKASITILTIYSGAYGGVLTPSISIGAAFGCLIGLIYSFISPATYIFETSLIGSTSFLAASQQAPLLALFMVFELCHLDISSIVTLGVGVILATMSSIRFSEKYFKY